MNDVLAAIEREDPELERRLPAVLEWMIARTRADRALLVIPAARDPFHVCAHRMASGSDEPKEDAIATRPLIQRPVDRREATIAPRPFASLMGMKEISSVDPKALAIPPHVSSLRLAPLLDGETELGAIVLSKFHGPPLGATERKLGDPLATLASRVVVNPGWTKKEAPDEPASGSTDAIEGLVGSSSVMKASKREVMTGSSSPANVLILGER
jgi:transcriptional regulator with GAF, ATPase, and Fis domain